MYFNLSKTKINLYYIARFISHRAVDTRCLGYGNEPVNIVWGKLVPCYDCALSAFICS
jgi:hypothetical protein